MPHQFVKKVEPVVSHGLRELRAGAPVDHVFRQVAVMGALIGSGLSPSEAIRAVEHAELMGTGPSGGWSAPVSLGPTGVTGWPFGKGAQVPTGPWLWSNMG